MKKPLGSLNKTKREFSGRSPMQRPIVGVWDQWCVMSAKPYVKMTMGETGEPEPQVSVLDVEHCKKIVRNFAASKDDLPCTLGHQKDTVTKAQFKTASYSAMATWHNGKVVEFATHNASILPPEEADLPAPDNGGPPDDGNYVFRARVTPLGARIIETAAVSKTSPEFVMSGLDQYAEEIGPQALGLAWTDDPFLNGCEINLERFTGEPLQMICLVPPPELAAKLVIPGGGEPSDLHCTLAVLDRPNPAAAQVAAAFARRFEAIDGIVSGPARFTGGPADVICALVDCPGLGEMRAQLVRELEAAGCTVKADHDFQPHITLAFVTPAETMPARIDPVQVRFGELVCQLGPQQQRYPFGARQETTMKRKFEKEAGVDEKDKDDAKLKKYQNHYGRKMLMEAGVADADTPAAAVEKFSKHMTKLEDAAEMSRRQAHEAGDASSKTSQQHAEPDEDNMGLPHAAASKMDKDLKAEVKRRFDAGELADQKAVMEAYAKAHMAKFGKAFEYEDPIVVEGAPTLIDEPLPNNNVVDGGGHAMERAGGAAREQIKALSHKVQSAERRIQSFEATEAVRKRDDKLRTAREAVNEAWDKGQIVLKPNETEKQAKERFTRHYLRGPDAFEDALAPEGTEATAAQTRKRYTSAGLPLNFERDRELKMEASRPDEEIIRLAEIKRKENPKLSRFKAAEQVKMERPDLAKAYGGQAKRAMLEG